MDLILEDKRLSYRKLLKRLEVPEDAPQTRICANCGQPMQMVKVNKYFVYFIHSSEQQAMCAEKNPTGLKLPLLWSNKLMIRRQLDKYYEEVTGHPVDNKIFDNGLEVKQSETPH